MDLYHVTVEQICPAEPSEALGVKWRKPDQTLPYLACAGRGHLRISIGLIWIIILTVVARQQSYCFQRQLHRVLWCMGIHMLTIVWAVCNKFMIGY